MVKIVQNGNPVLRQIAKEIPIADIKKPRIQNILKEMSQSLSSQNDGVALAAPQIGLPLRIFIVSGRIFDNDFMAGKEVESKGKDYLPDLVFINPTIKKISRRKELMTEGCLSVRPIWGEVPRATKATIEAYNEEGEKFIRNGSGLLAQIFQHETDHLEGILFIDKAKDIREVQQ